MQMLSFLENKLLIHNSSNMWKHPWKYKESFTIAFIVIVVGFIIEYFSGFSLSPPGWPVNILIILFFVLYIGFTYAFIKHPVVRWFSSIPAAVAAILMFTVLVLIMGFVKQNDPEAAMWKQRLGLTEMVTNWAFILMTMFLLVILGFTIARRFLPLTTKNFAFFLNHAGLWIILAAGTLGSGDTQVLRMPINEGQKTVHAFDKQGRIHTLPFALKLVNFEIHQYNPNILLLNHKTGKIVDDQQNHHFVIEEGNTGMIRNWEVKILKYYETSTKADSGYIQGGSKGSAPVAQIAVTNTIDNTSQKGWISCGSFVIPPEFFALNDQLSLVMTVPEPRKYASEVEIFKKSEIQKITIEVNKPYKVEGWKIYQIGYDEKRGRWSELSILELVRDPWLPFVYVGIFMVLSGTLYLLWMGKSVKSVKQFVNKKEEE